MHLFSPRVVPAARRVAATVRTPSACCQVESLEPRRLMAAVYSVEFVPGGPPQTVVVARDPAAPAGAPSPSALKPIDFELTNLTTGTPVAPAITRNPATGTARLAPPAAPYVPPGVFADGNYELTFAAEDEADPTDPRRTLHRTHGFWQLAGDVNRDRQVDAEDIAHLLDNYTGAFDGTPGGVGKTHAQGDLDGDGDVDNGDLNAISSNFGMFVPPPPDGPNAATATPHADGTVSVQWTAPASGAWDGFRVYRSPDGRAWAQVAAVADPAARAWTDSGADLGPGGLKQGTRYHYRVRPYSNDAGVGVATNSYAAVTLLPAPTDVVAVMMRGGGIGVGWSSNSQDETGFTVYRQDSPGGAFLAVGSVGPGETSFADETDGAVPGASFKVGADGMDGSGSAQSDASDPVADPDAYGDVTNFGSDFRYTTSTEGFSPARYDLTGRALGFYQDDAVTLSADELFPHSELALTWEMRPSSLNFPDMRAFPGHPTPDKTLAVEVDGQEVYRRTWTWVGWKWEMSQESSHPVSGGAWNRQSMTVPHTGASAEITFVGSGFADAVANGNSRGWWIVQAGGQTVAQAQEWRETPESVVTDLPDLGPGETVRPDKPFKGDLNQGFTRIITRDKWEQAGPEFFSLEWGDPAETLPNLPDITYSKSVNVAAGLDVGLPEGFTFNVSADVGKEVAISIPIPAKTAGGQADAKFRIVLYHIKRELIEQTYQTDENGTILPDQKPEEKVLKGGYVPGQMFWQVKRKRRFLVANS